MCRYLKYIVLSVCMPLFLAACLPGESETRSTLDNASQASVTVQAEKLASHLLTTATSLASSTAGSEVSDIVNQDLATIICAGNQIVSYIPNTATTSNNGIIPPAIAREMRGYLETRVGKDHVVSTENAPGCVNTELVATNSPIVVLNMAVAQIEEPQANQSEIIGVHMQPCPNNQPGVIITKTSLDGNSVTQNHCGTAAPTELPEIVLTEGKIADWQRRLAGPSGGSDPDAVRNFVCIAGDKGCDPIAPEMGTQIQCDDQDETVEYITNPVFNPQNLDGKQNYKFFPTASRDCNEHGWKGELIARVKSKNCQIIRNGKQEEVPAKVYDVAYVGAQCRKDQVLIEDLCPVGFPFSETGMMTSTKNIIMDAPIALQPHYDQSKGQNVSSVAYYNAGPNGIATNTDSVTLQLVNDGNTGRARTQSVYGSKAMPLFMSTENLGPLTKTYDFDNSFTRQLSEAKKATEVPLICHALGQNCNPGNTPVMYAMVVDRSASMTAKTPDIVVSETVCRATMADIFKKELRVEACQAAKTWQKITNEKLAVRNEMLDRWDTRREPTAYGSFIYDQLIDTADSFTESALIHEEMIMYNALRDKSKYNLLKDALSKGQDCYPRQYNPLSGRYEVPVQDNFYGSCAPVYASPDDLANADYTKRPLRDCQSSCPGICVTDTVEARNPPFTPDPVSGKLYPNGDPSKGVVNKPVKRPSTRMSTVDSFMQSNLIANLPPGVIFQYYEFFANSPYGSMIIDRMDSTDPKSRAVEFVLSDNTVKPDPDLPTQYQSKVHFQRELQKTVGKKFESTHKGKALGGNTPLYEAIDEGLKGLMQKVLAVKNGDPLKTGPYAPTVLGILSDGDANAGSKSQYFGTNVCEPEDIPEAYQCMKTRVAEGSPGFLGAGTKAAECKAGETDMGCFDRFWPSGKCKKRTCGFVAATVNPLQVRDKEGVDSPETRKQYCQNQHGAQEVRLKYPANRTTGQYDSLVGIVGRNFPNTKIFYIDIGGTTTLAQNCRNERVRYQDPNDRYSFPKQIMHTFVYDDNSAETISKAFGQMTGGGLPTIEAGEAVCKAKYPLENIPINRDPLDELALEFKNFNSMALDFCEDPTVLDVEAKPGDPIIPPNYIPNPVIPPVTNPYEDPYGDCINGRHRYTLRPCTGGYWTHEVLY